MSGYFFCRQIKNYMYIYVYDGPTKTKRTVTIFQLPHTLRQLGFITIFLISHRLYMVSITLLEVISRYTKIHFWPRAVQRTSHRICCQKIGKYYFPPDTTEPSALFNYYLYKSYTLSHTSPISPPNLALFIAYMDVWSVLCLLHSQYIHFVSGLFPQIIKLSWLC